MNFDDTVIGVVPCRPAALPPPYLFIYFHSREQLKVPHVLLFIFFFLIPSVIILVDI